MKQKRILLIKTHAIGDLILIVPAIRAVRKKYPDAMISLLVGKWSSALLANYPALDELIVFDDTILHNRHVFGILQLIRRIRRRRFETVYIFHQSNALHLFAWLAGIPERIGFSNSIARFLLTRSVIPRAPYDRYVAEVYCDLVDSEKVLPKEAYIPDLHIETAAAQFAETFWMQNRLEGRSVAVIFAGGGVNPAESNLTKVMPISFYAEIISYLNQIDWKIILVGGERDCKRVQKLFEMIGERAVNVCGKTSLLETTALLAKSDILLSNDSSPIHIAVALNVPSIVFFGSTSGRSLLPDDSRHKIIQSPLPCSPCYTFSRFPGCENPGCLQEISAEIAIKELGLMRERIRLK